MNWTTCRSTHLGNRDNKGTGVTFGQTDLSVFPTDLGVHSMMPKLMDACRRGVWRDRADRLGNIEIALAEALNNIAEHGFDGLAPEPVQVQIDIGRTRIEITLVDRGHPYPAYQLPEPKTHDLSVDATDLPEGGFGWMLIHSLTSELIYTRTSCENRLSLCFDLEEMRA